MAKPKKITVATQQTPFKPYMVSEANTTPGPTIPSGRSNRAATISSFEKYKNIRQGVFPYHRNGVGSNAVLDIREIVELCQLTYYNFPLFRNAIDTMTDLANSQLGVRGGNLASRTFITAWFEKIKVWQFADQFFREYFRSSNVFIYRFDGDFSKSDKLKFQQVFGADQFDPNNPVNPVNPQYGELETTTQIPLRYMILNPADIRCSENISFTSLTYFKFLTNYELARLRNPQTPEDEAVINNFGADAIKAIKQGSVPILPLNQKHLSFVFGNKQDYEPFAVPWGFPVLEDIESKLELKKMDAAVARTTEYAILLITMGESPKDGGLGVNPDALAVMNGLFQSDSLKKVLVSDFTTKASWLIPDLTKVLGKTKYEQLDNDIHEGLNMILTGDEKFANSQAKVEVFVERLNKSRKVFLDWLNIEVRRLCKLMSFKAIPELFFEDINLSNPIEYIKIFTQLMSLGILTPEEGFKAIETGELPTIEENVESQLTYKKQRDKGLYNPLVGGPKPGASPGMPGGNGRPTGTTGPKSSNKVSPQGTKKALGYSLSIIKDLLQKSNVVYAKIEKSLKKKFKVEELNKEQKEVVGFMLNNIISNESPDMWEKSVSSYIKEPKEILESTAAEIDNICLEYDVEPALARFLKHAQIEFENE